VAPRWRDGGTPKVILGSEDLGLDLLSAIMFGARMSLLVGFLSVVLSVLIGVTLGLISGYGRGKADSFIMRIADVQISFPAILIALLIDGVARTMLPRDQQDALALNV